MSSLSVCDRNGTPAGSFEIADELLVLGKGAQAVCEAVTAHRAAKRAGTASTLSKGQVSGSNRKPWRQKGTGRARAGYRQSPVWRGGGVAFGPHPRDYTQKLPRKVARLAFGRALSEKIAAGAITVVEQLEMPEPKTKAFVALMSALKIESPALFLVEQLDRNLTLASRNVPGVEVIAARAVDTYQLLRYPRVVASRPAMGVLKARLERVAGNKT
ncbi:MAG: 50S ribosomal protein L4 [Kiritimatiellae bacterium]|nr:50S ribosomal protein L4 [Kiritimatiellia bacterium]